jgi:polyhydroxyalkanoate synthesis regulator protein
VLTQIIVEEESKGGPTMLPVSFLRQLISFYGDSLQTLVPRYLEFSMKSFARNQEQMRKYLESMQDTFGGLFPFGRLEDVGKQNLAMFEQAMNFFAPFRGEAAGRPGAPAPAPKPKEAGAESAQERHITELEQKIAALQEQFAQLAKKKGEPAD